MTINNTEEIIKFNETGFIKITRTNFEFHYGIVNPEKFIIPINSISKVRITKSSYKNSVGCNIFGIIFNLIMIALFGSEPAPLVDDNMEVENAKIEIRYKLNSNQRHKRREISWIGLTNKKAEKIVGILKMNNKKLV